MDHLQDVHTIAEKFLRNLNAVRNLQPIAEEVIVKEFVNFVRPDGKYFSGIKRDGTQVWASEHRFALSIPSNVMTEYSERFQDALPVWSMEGL
jgi:hypothetical protein